MKKILIWFHICKEKKSEPLPKDKWIGASIYEYPQGEYDEYGRERVLLRIGSDTMYTGWKEKIEEEEIYIPKDNVSLLMNKKNGFFVLGDYK